MLNKNFQITNINVLNFPIYLIKYLLKNESPVKMRAKQTKIEIAIIAQGDVSAFCVGSGGSSVELSGFSSFSVFSSGSGPSVISVLSVGSGLSSEKK